MADSSLGLPARPSVVPGLAPAGARRLRPWPPPGAAQWDCGQLPGDFNGSRAQGGLVPPKPPQPRVCTARARQPECRVAADRHATRPRPRATRAFNIMMGLVMSELGRMCHSPVAKGMRGQN